MKRRQALKSIVVVSAGIVLFPKCKPGDPLPVYSNLILNRDQFNLIEDLANTILDKGELEVNNPESTKEFILNMVNDCYSPEDCEKYVNGLKAFENLVKEKFNSAFSKLDTDKKLELFKSITEVEEVEEEKNTETVEKENLTKDFLNTTRRFTIQHFTGSEYYRTNHTDWKFIPGDYLGCVSI